MHKRVGGKRVAEWSIRLRPAERCRICARTPFRCCYERCRGEDQEDETLSMPFAAAGVGLRSLGRWRESLDALSTVMSNWRLTATCEDGAHY
jgi:hypothetical protein